jgi:glycerol-1-phosphatase
VPALASLCRRYDQLLLDLDGCVWVGDEPTPRAVEAVEALRAAGKQVAFVTNNAWASGEEHVRKLWRLGFKAGLEEVVTAGGALQHVLAESGWRTAFVVGSPAVHRHVTDAGLRIVNFSQVPAPDVVVVAGHDSFDYAQLRGAVRAIEDGAELIASDRDASFPMDDGAWPGTGAVLAAIETVTGAGAQIVGKPAAQIFATALDRLGDGRTLVVGDRIDADLAGAAAAGLDGALVLTGATDRVAAEAAKDPAPVAIAATLADLVLQAGG